MGEVAPWIILRSIKGLGERSINKLISRFGDPVTVLEADRESLSSVVGPRRAEVILRREGVDVREIEELERTIRREGIKVLTLTDPEYPRNLRSIPDPPPLLFLWGDLIDVPLVGIVGPRRPSSYTLGLVESLVSSLVQAGYGTVSGGAVGVDMKVHRSTVELSGYTLCVLGFGLLKAGKDHLKLLRRPAAALVSEMLPHEPGSRHSFPKRNRIIAALSEFLVVPEAGPRSGALITADHAIRYGKKVYAHVGDKRSERWKGCSRLVEAGLAKPFKGVDDIVSLPREGLIYEFLKTPRTFDEIVSFLGEDPYEAVKVLTDLELKGKLRREGPYYVSC